ncbi:hypothetical protein N7532_005346 [Penicillium argentinense]|uniref:Uncharacterized protein n=1 Tax=Penicillium argentinense TaxID=1131581 RepID=A0A9W9FDR3_9EURO|nr:uncharacterized protein N7532_005346 [Penicillium argentinense]KAJ5098345.1 hypothetical protein N7532_005346 [Penicillium argentinense]
MKSLSSSSTTTANPTPSEASQLRPTTRQANGPTNLNESTPRTLGFSEQRVLQAPFCSGRS